MEEQINKLIIKKTKKEEEFLEESFLKCSLAISKRRMKRLASVSKDIGTLKSQAPLSVKRQSYNSSVFFESQRLDPLETQDHSQKEMQPNKSFT